jgi:uncharacterized membrane protein
MKLESSRAVNLFLINAIKIQNDMRKGFGIFFIIIGIICLPTVITPSALESIGRLIGVTLASFLPAYLLLRHKDKKQGDDNGAGDKQPDDSDNGKQI